MKKILFLLLVTVFTAQAQLTIVAADTILRGGNNTTYADQDIITAATARFLKFPIARVNYGSFFITGGKIVTDTANVANATFDLHIFSDTTGITTLPADNAAFTVSAAAARKRIGVLTFALVTGGTGSTGAYAVVSNVNFEYAIPSTAPAASSKYVWGVLVARGAYVPKHAGTIYLELRANQTR